ncbi:MAG TPA: M28 family peptidase [Solirubrobacteraceae bacterium]|jgi:hypothetical protein
MLNGRLYRVAFVPFVFALAIAAFSLSPRPLPFSSTLAPDAFEGPRAFAELRSLGERFPARRPGSVGDERLARTLARELEGLGGTAGGGFSVRTQRVEGETIDGQRGLLNVIAERPGSTSARPILILAHRDAAARGSLAELSGTAALLELARVFAGRETKRTIVLASTSGGSGGDAGAAQLSAALRGPFDAAIVLGDVAGARVRKPSVLPFSDGLGLAPLALQRTLTDAITQQAGFDPGAPSVLGQLAHLTFPLAVGEQGVLDAEGLPAVLVQVSGERGPAPGEGVSSERLQGLGRSVLSAVDALDAAPDLSPTMQTSVVLQHQRLPEWAVRLLAITLLLPVLVAAADGLARVRRRRRSIGRATVWALSCALPFLCCAFLALLLGWLGIVVAPSVPAPSGAIPLQGKAIAAVLAVALAFVLAWLLWQRLIARLASSARPDGDVAGLALLLVLLAIAFAAWIGNPFTALLALPALHLWLLLAAPELRPRRAACVALVAVGLAPLALLIAFYARQLGLGAGGVAWSALLLVAGGHVGVGAAILWSLALGCGAGAVLLAAAPAPPAAPRSGDGVEVTIRGPLSYAGPGSLGGTESALRR